MRLIKYEKQLLNWNCFIWVETLLLWSKGTFQEHVKKSVVEIRRCHSITSYLYVYVSVMTRTQFNAYNYSCLIVGVLNLLVIGLHQANVCFGHDPGVVGGVLVK